MNLKRFKKSVLPFHMAAYLLHPKYQGEGLTPTHVKSARAKDPVFVNLTIQFQAKGAPFPDSFFDEVVVNGPAKVQPLAWWKSVGRQAPDIPAPFIELMIQLHSAISAVASSASIEKIFSTDGHVHRKLRNKMGMAKPEKLVFCYRMLNGIKYL